MQGSRRQKVVDGCIQGVPNQRLGKENLTFLRQDQRVKYNKYTILKKFKLITYVYLIYQI